MKFIQDYLSFSKRERTGVIVLLSMIIVVFTLPEFIRPAKTSIDPKTATDIRKRIAELKLKENDTSFIDSRSGSNETYKSHIRPSKATPETQLFHFDPNTLPEEGWRKLGIHQRTIRTIKNYTGKGGRFRKPEDLGKIYGIRNDQYEKLLPFVKIKTPEAQLRLQHYEKSGPPTKGPVLSIELNTADTSELIALPGIGSKLANRILNFRTRLGGFYSIEQVREVYGLHDSTYQKIKHLLKCDTLLVAQININTADLAGLRNHPYIKWNIANAIINYRVQHGNFSSIEELLKIQIIAPDLFERLIPYLKVN